MCEVEEVKIGKILNVLNILFFLLEFCMYELDKINNYIVVCCSGGRSGIVVCFFE